ncbi:major facilitator superfamily domain-containing protein [Lentinula raphanica]|nr:major facilitator superfamily domain-containing protein [Lentinula raphanica]
MVAPATETIAAQFGIMNDVIITITTSILIFASAYAVGPLACILGPLSEIYGRSRVLQAANLFYLFWNLTCGFAQNTAQLLVFRFLAGLGGSAPLSIGVGVLVGPIADAWIADKSGGSVGDGGGIGDKSNRWRWVFWSTTTIVDAAVQVAGLFGSVQDVKTGYPNQEGRTIKEIFQRSLTRPYTLFAREPIAQVIGLYMAFVYGVFYVNLTTIPTVCSTGIGTFDTGLRRIVLLKPEFRGTYALLSTQRPLHGQTLCVFPEQKPRGGEFLLPVGLLISGWASEQGVSWVVTDLGMAFVGAGIILTFQSMQTYIVDCYTLHAASALASISCLRSIAGFGFPLFAHAMYNATGFGKGDTILAAVSIAVGWPAPISSGNMARKEGRKENTRDTDDQ